MVQKQLYQNDKKKLNLLLVLVLVITVYFSFVSSSPSQLFDLSINIRDTQETPTGLISNRLGDSRWTIDKYRGKESQFLKPIFINQKDKKTQICFIPKNESLDGNLGEMTLYGKDKEPILDNKNKTIVLKYETGKCNGVDGYSITLTNAQFINVDDYIQIGNNTISVVYQNISEVFYSSNWFNLSSTLYVKIGDDWNNTINDIFVFDKQKEDKFGANVTGFNTTQTFKYVINSSLKIYQESSNIYYTSKKTPTNCGSLNCINEEKHKIDFSDICIKDNFSPQCSYSGITQEINGNNTRYILEVEFLSEYNETHDKILIDPSIVIDEIESYTGLGGNVTTDTYPSSHISVNEDNLILYFPFDLETKADVNETFDYSDSTLSGDYLQGATGVKDFGFIGGSANFSNGCSLCQVRVDADSNLNWIGVENFTIMFWTFPYNSQGTTYVSNDNVFSDGNDSGIQIKTDFGRDIIVTMLNSSTDSTAYDLEYVTDVNENTWTHIAVVKNGTTVQIYENGQFGNAHTVTGEFNNTRNLWWFGFFAGNQDLDGLMDEIMIFNISLTSTQINNYYSNTTSRFKQPSNQIFTGINFTQNGSLNKVNITTNTTQNFGTSIQMRLGEWNETNPFYEDSINGNLDSDIKLWVHFDNDSTYENDTHIFDWSNNGNNMSFNGDAKQNSTGFYSGGVHFDGVDDYLNTPDDPSISGLSSLTLSFWLYKAGWENLCGGVTCINQIVGKSPWTGGDREYRVRYESGLSSITFHVSGDGNDPGSNETRYEVSNLDEGKWHHIVGTWNNNTGDLKLYHNGVEVDSATYSASSLYDGNADFSIGSSSDNGAGSRRDDFNGSIDDVVIWERALNDGEVFQVYNDGKLKYQYGDYKNVSNGNNNVISFNITTSTDILSLDVNFSSDSNNFYTPILHDDIAVDVFSFTAGDTVPPLVTINFPLNNNYSITSVNFNVTLSENGSVMYSLDGGVNNVTMFDTENGNIFGTLFNVTNSSIADGEYKFSVYANDTAGNNNYTESVNFTIDNTPPSLTINSPTDGSLYNIFTVNFKTTVSDETLSVDSQVYSINGQSNVSFDGDEDVNLGSSGSYDITFCVNDTVNNINCSSVSITLQQQESQAGGTQGGSGTVIINEIDRFEIDVSGILKTEEEFKIIVTVFNQNNETFDPDIISIYPNETGISFDSSDVERIGTGVYERTFFIYEPSGILSFNIFVKEGDKSLLETKLIEIEKKTDLEKNLEKIKQVSLSSFDKIGRFIRENLLIILIVILSMLMFLIFLANRNGNEK